MYNWPVNMSWKISAYFYYPVTSVGKLATPWPDIKLNSKCLFCCLRNLLRIRSGWKSCHHKKITKALSSYIRKWIHYFTVQLVLQCVTGCIAVRPVVEANGLLCILNNWLSQRNGFHYCTTGFFDFLTGCIGKWFLKRFLCHTYVTELQP